VVQIVTASDGLHVWSSTVAGSVDARFEFFDVVSGTLLNAIPRVLAVFFNAPHVRLGNTGMDDAVFRWRADTTTSASASIPQAVRDAYERGCMALRIRTTASIARATALFAQVTAVAPDFARGHAGLAQALLHEVGMTMRSSESAVDAIRTAVNAALEHDPRLPEAHTTLGALQLFYEHDWPRAERSLLRAIDVGPSYVSAYRAYAFGLTFMRRFDEAELLFAQAHALDPLDAKTRINQGLLLFYRRRFASAATVFSDVLETDANDVLARTLLAASHLHAGDHVTAETMYREACARHPDLSIGLCGLAVTLAHRGDFAASRDTRRLLVAFGHDAFVSPYQLAMIDCALGEHNAALDGLERAARCHDYNFQCSAVDPTFDALHGTPRWRSLMQRFGLPDD
jgi:adenylate cyclase